MAKDWWESAPLAQEQPEDWWKSAPLAQEKPKEDAGLIGSFTTALKERIATAGPAAKLYTGLGDQEQATKDLLQAKKDTGDAYKQVEFSEIGDAFKSGKYGEALDRTYEKFKEVAGSSFGAMGPAMAAGAVGALAAPAALPAAAVGTAAFGLTALGSYIADNIGRQKEEQQKLGQEGQDINRLTATAAAAGQTALDIFGFKFFKPLGALVGIEGKATAERAAMEIVEAATKPKAYRRAVAMGTAQGIAFEVPQEVTQSVLERWQAGLPIDPFSDPNAAKEYMEAAGGAMLLGGPMGAYSKARETAIARGSPEGQAVLKQPTEGSLYEKMSRGEGVPEPDATGEIEPSKPVLQSGEPPGLFDDVESGAAVTPTPSAPAAPTPAAPEQSLEAYADFVRQYTDLRDEYNSLPSGTIDQAGMNQRKLIMKDLASVVDANMGFIRSKGVAQQLKNPVFDGSKVLSKVGQDVGQAHAMQGDLFGTFQGAARRAKNAMALGGQDTTKAVEVLEQRRAEAQQKIDSGGYTDEDIIRLRPAGMSAGQALKNRDVILQELSQRTNAEVDQAIDLLQKQTGQPRAMQGDLFEKRKPLTPDQMYFGQEEANLTAKAEDAQAMADREQVKVDSVKEKIANGISTDQGLVDTLAEQTAWLQGEADKAKAKLEQVREHLREIGHPRFTKTPDTRAMQGNLFSTQQRVDTLESEKTRLTRALGTASAELKRMQDLAARPAGETRPSPEAIAKLTSDIASYERNLQGVLRDLEGANQDLASGVEPVAIREKQEAPQLTQTEMFDTAELQKENTQVMRERRAASAEEPREVTERRQREKPPVDEYADLAEEAPAEPVRQGAPPPQKGVKAVKKEEEAIDHVRRTPEGRLIISLFDAIESQNQNKDEVARHDNSKNTAENELLEFDITDPTEPTSEGVGTALKYLTDRVGGTDKFREMVGALQSSVAGEQSAIFRKYGLPDLSTRRGIDKFSGEVQEYFKQRTAKGAGIPTRLRGVKSPITGKTVYSEKFSQDVGESQQFETAPGEMPREPSTASRVKEYFLADSKIAEAMLTLRQSIESRKLSPQILAAKTYFDNLNRDKIGDALRDVAFDLAYNEGANTTFYGEGGDYARYFKEWIDANLDPATAELVNELIADHKVTLAANEKYNTAITKYNEGLDAYAEKRRQEAEKISAKKIAKAPKRHRNISERLKETEAGETEETKDIEVSKKGLPTVQGLYEVHTAISRAIEEGDTNKALTIMSESPGNPYYAALAKRMLEAGITAKTTVIGADELVPLSGGKETVAVLRDFTSALRDVVVNLYPQDQQATLISALRSNNLRDIVGAVGRIQSEMKDMDVTKGQEELIADAVNLLNKQFAWRGKYDPATDEIMMRSGSGITNHLFLHEALHAALSNIIDNGDSLQGIQRQGYDQLLKLYNHAKGVLSAEGLAETNLYGLSDIHEFVSEALTNPVFQAKLRAIRFKAAPFSLYTEFTRALRKIFGIKEGYESNVLNETILSTDAMMLGGVTDKSSIIGSSGPKAMAGATIPTVIPSGRANTPTMLGRMMTSRSWDEVKGNWPLFYSNLKSNLRPIALGALTTRQIADLVNKRLPQLDNFIRVTEEFLARKNSILRESSDISKNWERLQAKDPEMSRKLAAVMHTATIQEFDPDPRVNNTFEDKNANDELIKMWEGLNPEAQKVYREARDFFDRRYAQYKELLDKRIGDMDQFDVSETTITKIREEFERAKRKGPYFPLMRHGRFWYQVGKGANREYYMFESFGQQQAHIQERLAQNPELESSLMQGDQYQQQMDIHAKESAFLKSVFDTVDKSKILDKQELKDSFYQSWLANQPESSFRTQFIHRKKVAGYSEDALRNFAGSSFHMAYQLSRFEYSPEMFSQIRAARSQLKERFDADTNKGKRSDLAVATENNELSDYVKEMERRLTLILNPTDIGIIPSLLSNIGFIWYLTAPASAIVNVIGGMVIGLPTLIGQQVRLNPNMSYAKATLNALASMKTAAGQIMATGFSIERGERLRDNRLLFPSMERSTSMNAIDRDAYNKFIADGLIDITGTYDQSGLAASPAESYTGARHRGMQVLTAMFHNAEKFNREVMAMSAFRTAMEKRKNYADKQQAFDESIAEAKDITNRSMFDYSSPNKPRYFQHPVARVILQFKQYPQQMTFFLTSSFLRMLKKPSEDMMENMTSQQKQKYLAEHNLMKREATARFVGTMGMAGILSGVTGLWGFSTVANILNAVINGLDDDRDEPFDFELAFADWAINTFGKNAGTLLLRGAGNAAGIDLASRVKLDDMWRLDTKRNNPDEVAALQSFLIQQLGPSVGLTINVAEAVKLWNQGHADRALEMIAPAFIKQPLVAARYASEGAKTKAGDKLVEELGPFDLLMQSLGIRPAELAERQFYNIKKKGQEQDIMRERQNLLNLYALTFMSSDAENNQIAFDKIMKFSTKHPSVAIDADTIVKSIEGKMEKSAQTDHGLYIDPKLMSLLNQNYMTKISEK